MQALINFREDVTDITLLNEDIEDEIKEMLKGFHSTLVIIQQIVQVGYEEREREGGKRTVVLIECCVSFK